MTRLPRRCLDCGELTTHGSRCLRCTTDRARERPHRDAAARFRSTFAWQKLRGVVMRAHPWCERCGATDDLTVDHVVPIARAPELALDVSNLEVRCRRCNASKGARAPRLL